MDPSKIIFTLSLKLIISAKKLGSKGGNRQQMQTRNTPSKFAFSALESRFAPIVEHIKRKLKTCASSLLFENMTYQNFEGRVIQAPMTHIQKHSQSKKRVCAACGYIIAVCVCVREREREREKRREEKICSISQEPSYSTENKI